jgi:hypothetical protein
MNIVYAFIGKLPSYTVETMHQSRLFFDGSIYLITNDLDSEYINTVKSLNVTIVNYENVIDQDFKKIVVRNANSNKRHKIVYLDNLKGRENLFLYSFERFYILNNLMKQQELQNIFFMELDNLIYDNPNNWLEAFSQNEMTALYDNHHRYSAGIIYFKSFTILDKLVLSFNQFILDAKDFINEMSALYEFCNSHKSLVQMLPIHWPLDQVPKETYIHYEKYDSIFDAAPIGIFLGGRDPYHTDGVIKLGLKNPYSLLDFTNYKYKWELDDKQRKIPYVYNDMKWIRINNLHVHSKYLTPLLSKIIQK